MPSKARRDREKRAKQVKLALAEQVVAAGPSDSEKRGESEGSSRDTTGLTAVESAKLDGVAIRRGWVQLPFPTRISKNRLEEEILARDGEPTLVEKVALSVFGGLSSTCERRRGIAERNGIAMESHNLAVERHADQMNRPVTTAAPTAVNVQVVNRVQILRLPDNGRGQTSGQ